MNTSDIIPALTLYETALPAYVELFKIDCSSIIPNTVYYLTTSIASEVDVNGIETGVSTKILFGTQEYTPYPIQLTGLSQTTDGAFPRARLDVANILNNAGYNSGTNLFNAHVKAHEDLIGAEVTYIRTFKTYLSLPSSISAPPMKYYIAKKLNHDSVGISFELRSALDKERAFLPARQMLKRDFPGLGINKAIR